MAERERRTTPPYGGVFVARSQVMDADDVRRAIWRMAHEVIERNHGLDGVRARRDADRRGRPGRRAGRRAPRDRRHRAAGRLARRRPVPRRHRHPPGAARGGHRHPRRHRRRHRGAGRRRALHRSHHPRRPRRPQRLRPAPVGAARGDGRPRPPRAADPTRLRRQEPADPPRRDGERQPRGRRPRRGGEGDEAPPLHRRPHPRRHRAAPRAHRRLRRGEPAQHPEGARAARQERRVALLRGQHPHPAQLRAGRQAPLGRHDDLQRRLLVGEEGRVAARHRAHHRGDGRRRGRRAPRLGGVPWQIARWLEDRVERRQRRRRLARAPHPGAARQLHDPRGARHASTGCTSASSATSSTAGWPAPT